MGSGELFRPAGIPATDSADRWAHGKSDKCIRAASRARDGGDRSLPPLLGPFASVGVFSHRLARIHNIEAFLNAKQIVCNPLRRGRLDAVAGWGHKPTADQARAFARRHRLPYLAVEDGFLRSLDLGVSGTPPLSLIVDDIGIYYYSNRPSRLEVLLNQDVPASAKLLRQAKDALARIQEYGLSKYNRAPEPDASLLPPTTRPRVLVVDQTRDDMSVLMGRGNEVSFHCMLERALDENPGAEILVKLHPDTIAGVKRGYLSELRLPDRARVIAEDISPQALLQRCERVYTVTSQLGFEALLAGLPVSCHGMPFYAGWGATEDRLSCPRRRQRRSLLEIFAAAWLGYARYVDPVTGRPCGIERVIDLLAAAKRVNEANRGTTICLGMRRWKRRHLRPFLASTGGRTIFARSGAAALRKGAKPGDRLLVWGESEPPGLAPLVSQLGATVGRIEDGFLRSIGLGSDFVRPSSLAVDWHGTHYDPSRPSDLETLLAETDFTPVLLARAARLRRRIVDARLSKYNVGRARVARPAGADERHILLVPGQVEDDASVRLGCAGIRTNLALVQAVREADPDAFIVFKPHPDVVARNRGGGRGAAAIEALCDAVWRGANILDCLDLADEVHTLTSLTGFEALLRGKPVVTYGGPFYAGWGLTRDRMDFPRRGRTLTVDALVAGALMLYPRYYDRKAGIVCDAEAVVERLAAGGSGPPDAGPVARPDRAIRRLARLIGGWVHA